MNNLYIKDNINSSEFLDEVLKINKINNYEIITNKYGKKYLKNNEIFFNISNKDNITVIATSINEVGVDIERITFNEKVFEKVFNDEEKKIVNNSTCKEEEFTIIFSKKEAYVKMLGIGLSYGLLNVDTIKLNDLFNIKKYNNNYYVVVCSKE